MKASKFRIIAIIAIVFLLIGFVLLKKNSSVSRVVYKLPDLCPQEVRLPVKKDHAVISKKDQSILITHPVYKFRYVISDNRMHFEENTIQDYEEPISLPSYAYSMYMTYGQSRNENQLAPLEVRFIIYSAHCNTESSWQNFLLQQGWYVIPDFSGITLFQGVEKKQSGRVYQRYFHNDNTWHYEFEISKDTTGSTNESVESANSILSSFVLVKDEETHEAK